VVAALIGDLRIRYPRAAQLLDTPEDELKRLRQLATENAHGKPAAPNGPRPSVEPIARGRETTRPTQRNREPTRPPPELAAVHNDSAVDSAVDSAAEKSG
jgi:hypothetical protein